MKVTAQKAYKLAKSFEQKSAFHNICSWIDKQILNKANKGEYMLIWDFTPETYSKYIKKIKKHYSKLGFQTIENSKSLMLTLAWG